MSFVLPGFDAGCGPATAEEAAKLRSSVENQCQQAATALAESDVLLLVTGAGFSADSGLAVYRDVAQVPAYQEMDLNYSDICTMDWLEDDEEIFYGFWGQCFNDYRQTKPHEGYKILARWKHNKVNQKQQSHNSGSNFQASSSISQEIQRIIARKVNLLRPFDDDDVVEKTPFHVQNNQHAGAFFSFTSNVDAHFYDHFEAHEIHECHGNIELWQCSSPYCISGVWRAPLQHSFLVNTDTMLAPATRRLGEASHSNPQSQQQQQPALSSDDVAHIGHTTGQGVRENSLRNMPPSRDRNAWFLPKCDKAGTIVSNYPFCRHCKSLARPAILMFGDFSWKPDRASIIRWSLWEDALLELCQKKRKQASQNNNNGKPLKVCIMEIGCGLRVPTCRMRSERMVSNIQQKGGEVKLVRINPDFPLTENPNVTDYFIPIMSRGLPAIKCIDQIYQGMMTANTATTIKQHDSSLASHQLI